MFGLFLTNTQIREIRETPHWHTAQVFAAEVFQPWRSIPLKTGEPNFGFCKSYTHPIHMSLI
jgi:hypothetical protein